MTVSRIGKAAAFGVSLLLSGTVVRSAAAGPDFLYVPQGAASIASPNVTNNLPSTSAGTQIVVPLYLLADATGIQVVTVKDNGLGAAGLAVTRVSGTGTIASFSYDSTDFSAFTQANSTSAASSTGGEVGAPITGVAFGNTGGGAVTGASDEIYLASVTFVAGAAGTSTVFDIGAEDHVDGDITLTCRQGYDIDVESQQPRQGRKSPLYRRR